MTSACSCWGRRAPARGRVGTVGPGGLSPYFLYDLAVLRRGQRHRPLSANTFWVGRRADGNAGPTQRLALHPANGRFRRVSPVSARPGEGPLPESIAGVRPARQELVFMPLSGHLARAITSPQAGGNLSLLLCIAFAASIFGGGGACVERRNRSRGHVLVSKPPSPYLNTLSGWLPCYPQCYGAAIWHFHSPAQCDSLC